MIKIYTTKGSLNDATKYYLKIITTAIKELNNEISFNFKLNEIHKDDIVIVLTLKDFIKVWVKRPRKIVIWLQGLAPEEVKLQRLNSFKKQTYNIFFTIFEYIALKFADLVFLVSESQRLHYQKKYDYKKTNYIIMPCFNQMIRPESFSNEMKYKKPTFVYIGNMALWQCFPETVRIFKKIKRDIPDAELLIYTKQKVLAMKILEEENVTATIEYVPYENISEKLSDIKYGFIIRKDDIINRVATPTKMNTYIANGIIPIYTNVIDSYNQIFSNNKYIIQLNKEGKGLNKLLQLENESIEIEEIYEEYTKYFTDYYSEDKYIKIIKERFRFIL